MTAPTTGSTVHAFTFDGQLKPLWQSLTLDKAVAAPGGEATVYATGQRVSIGRASRPLLAKIYNPTYRQTLIQSQPYERTLKRLATLVHTSTTLTRDLPFVAWPHQLICDSRSILAADGTIDPDLLQRHLTGISIPQIVGAASLLDVLLKPADGQPYAQDNRKTIALALTLASHVDRLHKHHNHFIFGDISPKNILIDTAAMVHFIDADSYQFTAAGDTTPTTFTHAVNTPDYNSPSSLQRTSTNQPLGIAHDLFVLAVLIFQVLSLRAGLGEAIHPFQPYDGDPVDDMIRRRTHRFQITPPVHRDKPDYLFWSQLHPPLRDGFHAAFTTQPLAAEQWVKLLSNHWRSLHRS